MFKIFEVRVFQAFWRLAPQPFNFWEFLRRASVVRLGTYSLSKFQLPSFTGSIFDPSILETQNFFWGEKVVLSDLERSQSCVLVPCSAPQCCRVSVSGVVVRVCVALVRGGALGVPPLAHSG